MKTTTHTILDDYLDVTLNMLTMAFSYSLSKWVSECLSRARLQLRTSFPHALETSMTIVYTISFKL